MRVIPFVLFNLSLLAGGLGCNFTWKSIDGSGTEASETLELAEFNAIQVADFIQVEVAVTPDQPQSVQVRGDDNIVPLLESRVSKGKLVLGLPDSFGIRPKLPLVVTIQVAALWQIEANDSANVKADRMESSQVSISTHDSGEVFVQNIIAPKGVSLDAHDSAKADVAHLTTSADISVSASDSAIVEVGDISSADTISLTAADSSGVTLAGKAEVLVVDLSDSSQLDAEDLTAQKVLIQASSSSSATVCATNALDATLSDSSAVTYTCDPDKITKHLDDSSSLSPK